MTENHEPAAASADSNSSRDDRWYWPNWARRKRMLHRQAWVIVIGSWLLYPAAWFIPQPLDESNPLLMRMQIFFFSIETLTDHAGMLLLAAVIGAAIGRKRRLLIAALPIMLLTAGPLLWQYVPKFWKPRPAETFRVMTINALYVNREVDAVIEQVLAADPDVLLVQEYTLPWHDRMQERLGERYPHYYGKPQDDAFGAAIYSRLPFESQPKLVYSIAPGELPQIRSVVRWQDRSIAIYNIHLLPPIAVEYVVARNGSFVGMLNELAEEPLPYVLVGDFNFTEDSNYHRLLRQMGVRDAQQEVGWGRASTWPARGIWQFLPFLGFRIDHVYLSESLHAARVRTEATIGSDHRAVISDVGFLTDD